MSAPLKTLAPRWPAAAAVARCCARPASASAAASFSTASAAAASACARPVCLARERMAAVRPACHARLTTPSTPAVAAAAARSFASASSLAAAASSPSAAASAPSKLDWDSFFKLRLRRRRIQVAFSVTTSLLAGAGGAILLSTGVAEPLVMQVPLDPFMTLGLMTFACAGLGWLVGPSIGNQVFYIFNHSFKTQMVHKEAEFFARIRKNRVDPSNSSAGNPGASASLPALYRAPLTHCPVPDFYGEKIQSVSGYRQWLKDQRAFNKKKKANFV